MTTLGIMKARIADEVFRDDAADMIAREISSSISYYQSHRFYFNERRTVTFSTVIGQSDYDSTTAVTSTPSGVTVAHLLEINAITTTYQGNILTLCSEDIDELESLIGSASTTRNVPSRYGYFGQTLRLYPIPDAVYTVRIRGLVRYPAPATDGELNNAWMTEAEELIRYRTKRNLYLNNFENAEQGQVMKALEQEAFTALKRESSMRQSVNTIQPAGI